MECPFCSQCTKAKEGNNRKIHYNEKWKNQKAYIQELLSDEETGEIYGKRKVDVEPTFGFLKANLRFTRMSVRGKKQVKNEIGFVLMAVNLRKYTARKPHQPISDQQKGASYRKSITDTFYTFSETVLSQPLVPALCYLPHTPRTRFVWFRSGPTEKIVKGMFVN